MAFSEQYDEIESAYCALAKQPSDATTEDGASSIQSKTHELQRRRLRVWLDEEIGKEHVKNSSTDRKIRGHSDVGTTPMNISRGPVDAHANSGLKVEKGDVDVGSIAGEDGPKNAQFGNKDIPGSPQCKNPTTNSVLLTSSGDVNKITTKIHLHNDRDI